MLPFSIQHEIVVADAAVAHQVRVPASAFITKVGVRRVGDGSISLKIYNKPVTSGDKTITAIGPNSAGKAVVKTPERHRLAVGDTITIADTDNGDNDGTHVVTAIIDENTFTTDQNYGGSAAVTTAGTYVNAIPSGDRDIYLVRPEVTGTNVTAAFNTPGYPVTTLENWQGGAKDHVVYLLFGVAATYKVVLEGYQRV